YAADVHPRVGGGNRRSERAGRTRGGCHHSERGRRLERLVTDLLELAKLDARRFSLDTRAVDVGEVITATVEGFRPAAEAEGLNLGVEVAPGEAPLATADPDRLAQVVANLVENALKFA